MAVIFNDTFTEASNTTLASHTPDTGTGWTSLISIDSSTMTVVAADDTCQEGTGGLSDGVLYTADATYASKLYLEYGKNLVVRL